MKLKDYMRHLSSCEKWKYLSQTESGASFSSSEKSEKVTCTCGMEDVLEKIDSILKDESYSRWRYDVTPICVETGDWDGRRSELLLCCDSASEYHLARCYEYHDGTFEWYDEDDFGLRHEVVKWKIIS